MAKATDMASVLNRSPLSDTSDISYAGLPVTLPQMCAPREKLLSIISRGAQKRYIYIHAPTGYGKTTSALLWLKKTRPLFDWLFVDSYYNAPSQFYRSLCRVLFAINRAAWNSISEQQPPSANTSLLPGDATQLPVDTAQLSVDATLSQFLINPAFAAAPIEKAVEFLTMLSWPNQPNKRCVLVLDDMHHIVNEEILKSLPLILRRLPHSFRVIFLSRAAIPEAMSAITDNNQTEFIGSGDIAFTQEEIQNLFINHGWIVSSEQAAAIHAYTDGWGIALNAILLSGKQKILIDGADGKVHRISKDEWDSRDGVSGVGSRTDRDSRIGESRADSRRRRNDHYGNDNRDAHRNLDDMTFSFDRYFEINVWNGFDETEKTFLMKTAVVDSFTPELCTKLTGNPQSAEILNNLIRGNINLSQLGNEYRYNNLFLKFLREKAAESGIDLSGVNRLAAEYYINNNSVFQARHFAVRSGDFAEMAKAVKMIYLSKNVNVDEYASSANIMSEDRLPDELYEAIPVLYLQRVFFAYLTGNLPEFKRCWDRIYSLLPVISEKYPQLMEANVTNCILDHRYSFAEHTRHIRGMPDVVFKNESDQVSSIGINMPFLHRSSRDCYQLTDESVREEVVANAFRDLLKFDCDNLFLGIQAGLYIEQNRLNEARIVLLKAVKLLNENVSIDLGWSTYVMLAETALMKGDRHGYDRYKTQARDYFEDREALYYMRNFTAYETRTRLWDFDASAAAFWLDRYFVNASEYGILYKIYQNFTTARAHIVLNNLEEALTALQTIKDVGKAFDRLLDVAEADVLVAILEWVSGKKKEASERLYNVLVMLKPYRFIRVIANEGKAVLPIIASVIRQMDRDARRGGAGTGTGGGAATSADAGTGGGAAAGGGVGAGGGAGTRAKVSAEETGASGASASVGSLGTGASGADATLYRFVTEVQLAAYEQSKRFKGVTHGLKTSAVKLSPKQTFILDMLAQGYKNAEIVAITGLTINTIREHTKVAYRKLEVTNVKDAVAKARQLGLLK